MVTTGYSLIVGLAGLAIAAGHPARPIVYVSAVVAFLSLVQLSVVDGVEGATIGAKMALAAGAFFFAAWAPVVALMTLVICLLLDWSMTSLAEGISKLNALPTAALMLLSVLNWKREGRFVCILLISCCCALFNVVFLDYRTEAILLALILISVFLHLCRADRWVPFMLFAPIVIAGAFYGLGAAFAISVEPFEWGLISVEPTASNFERAFLAHFGFAGALQNPFGQPMSQFTHETFEAARQLGRTLYSSQLMDPHNHFMFFTVSLGLVGAVVYSGWVAWVALSLATSPVIARRALVVSIPLVSVTSALFPYSTDQRLIAAVGLGAVVGLMGGGLLGLPVGQGRTFWGYQPFHLAAALPRSLGEDRP